MLQDMVCRIFFFNTKVSGEVACVTSVDTSIDLPFFCSLIALEKNGINKQKEGKLSTGNLLFSE